MASATSFRLPPETLDQIETLAERYGTKTAAVVVAVDRLYQQHQEEAVNMKQATCVCGEPLHGIPANFPERNPTKYLETCKKCGRGWMWGYYASRDRRDRGASWEARLVTGPKHETTAE